MNFSKVHKAGITTDQKFCLERIFGIIQCRRGSLRCCDARFPNRNGGFSKNKDIFINLGHFGGNRQPDHTGPDNNNIQLQGMNTSNSVNHYSQNLIPAVACLRLKI